MSASGWRAVTCSTTPISEPRCMGMCMAWHSVRPRTSKRHVELSRRSLTLVEYAARTSVSPISSTIEERALPITSTVIGSTGLGIFDDQVQILVDARALVWEHEGGRVHLFDDRRAGEHVAGRQPLTVIDGAGDEGPCFGEPDVTS